MVQATALLDSQATTLSYDYKTLPDTRWIRVLVLQPASNVEDPLIGSFETVSLGESLPPVPKTSLGLEEIGSEEEEALIGDEERIAKARLKVARDRERDQYLRVLSSRQLCYDALSYTWATENGDTSRSQSVLLEAGRMKITQNLAEGLRRLRSCTNPKQLWIDAICINQNDPAERGAQVAMMFDIYRLARNLIVWLGESAYPGEDYIVWLWIRCISDAEGKIKHDEDSDSDEQTTRERLPHGETSHFKGRSQQEEISDAAGQRHHVKLSMSRDEMVLKEAVDAFLRTETVQSRPPRVFRQDCPMFPRDEFSGYPVDSASHDSSFSQDSLEEWLAADTLRLSRFVGTFEPVLSLLERKYWKRRWVIQENFSRMPFCDGRIHWGNYSTDKETFCQAIQSAIEIISKLRRLPHIDSDVLSSILDLWHSVLCVVQPGVDTETDLLEKIRQFRELQCADPRDRLYSLLPLVSGHQLQADYTATFETVCFRFAKNMLEAGDMRVLYYAGDANMDPATALPHLVMRPTGLLRKVVSLASLAVRRGDGDSACGPMRGRTRDRSLPSWVPDLRGFNSEMPWSLSSSMADIRYCVSDDMSLTMEVYWIGDIRAGSAWGSRWGKLWQTWRGHIRRDGTSIDVGLNFETIRAPVAGRKDMLCMLDSPTRGNRFLWLRSVRSTRSTYRLVVSGEAVTRDQEGINEFGDFLQRNKESVHRSMISVTII